MRLMTLALTLILPVTAALAETPLRIGSEAARPPFNFLAQGGRIDGFDRVLGDEICRRAGLACEWVRLDWTGLLPALSAGRIDMVLSGPLPDKGLATELAASAPVWPAAWPGRAAPLPAAGQPAQAILIRAGDGALRRQLDAAIGGMKEDGTLNALIVQWFGQEAPLF